MENQVAELVLEDFVPKSLTEAVWTTWREPVLTLVREEQRATQRTSEGVAKRDATALCALIAATNPIPGTSWADILSDPRIATTVESVERGGLGRDGVKRTREVLNRLQARARGFGATPKEAPRRSWGPKETHHLETLPQLLQSTHPKVVTAVQQILDTCTTAFGDAGTNPVKSGYVWLLIRHEAARMGLPSDDLNWTNLQSEVQWRAFDTLAPAASVISALGVTPWRISQFVRNTTSAVQEPTARLRGSATISANSTWSIHVDEVLPLRSTALESFPAKPARKSQKTSAAAMRRATAALRDTYATPASALPENLEAICTSWTPRHLDAEAWALAKPLAVDIMRRSHIRGEESFHKHLRALAPFVHFALRAGYPDQAADILTETCIDEYCRRILATEKPETVASLRSTLRNIATHAKASDAAPLAPKTLPYGALRPPYTSTEVAGILHTIELQRSPVQKRVLQTVVALGLGAGLDARDLKDLTRAHIDDQGENGILITVPGDRPRKVWLRYDYESLLRTGIGSLRPNESIFGRTKVGKNALANLYDKTHDVSSDKIQQGRLRNTWLATLMCEPISLWEVMDAAGLSSARSLADLMPFLRQEAATPEPSTTVRGAA